jgi:hypothetical protein
MDVGIEYTFFANVRERGSRRAKEVLLTDLYVHDMPDVAPSDAVVVARWKSARYAERLMEVRIWNGSFYMPWSTNTHLPLTSQPPPLPMDTGILSRLVDGGISYGALDQTTVVDSAREDELDRTVSVAEGLMVVDGALWKKVSEPMFVLRRSGFAGEPGTLSCDVHVGGRLYGSELGGRFSKGMTVGSPALTAFVPLDRLDLLSEALEADGFDAMLADHLRCLEVLEPAAFTIDPTDDIVIRTLAHAVVAFEPDIARCADNVISAWFDLRDIRKHREAGGSVPDNLAETISEFAAMRDRDDTRVFELLESLDMWDSRQIAIPAFGGM